jgi:ATP synthase protein I
VWIGSEGPSAALVLIKSRPIRVVLYWQVCVTAALALVAGGWAGVPAGISALLGGLISVVGDFAYAAIVSRLGVTSAGNVLRMALRAEAVKIMLIVILLWLVFTNYKDLVALAFFAAFAVTVLMFRFALFIRDEK